jgi:hypothetical protein
VNLGTTASFSSEASHAARLREDNDRVLAELEQDLERARAPGGGEERWLAAAETFALMLRIQRANLVLYEAFCEDTGPAHANRRVEAYAPPELAPYGDDPTFLAISFTNLSLCHGVEPFRRLRLPGGEATAREIDDLAGAWNDFQARWHHTPYAQVVRRMGLARFHLVKTPGGPAPGERRIPDAKKAETVTLPERPARPERPVRPGGTSGGGSGPASGG